jgi:phosphatidate cytidylyltransferase
VGQWENFIAATGILFFPFVFLAFIHELYARSPQPFANVAFLVLGMVYIGVPFAMLHFIAFQGEHFHADTVLGLLLLTWSNDTAAYLVGSRFGHRLFFPRISPKKTWEGFLGAAAITLLAAWPISRLFSDPALRHWLALAVIVVVFGTVGDLVESMLKRSFARKDSGILLPGHGGMLDRFDAFIFLLPYATAYLLWIR